MSSSVEDNIELIGLNSPSSTKSYIKSKLKLKDNNVGSSPVSSPAHSGIKNETQNLFLAKQVPQPRPRLVPIPDKGHKRRSSKTTTEVRSDSQDTLDSVRDKRSGDEFTESIFSSRSDTRSQRERFRERFESVRKQAGKSISKAHTFKSKAEKVKGLKRSINLMKRENEEIETELKNYEKNRKSSGNDAGGISQTDAYNFFCSDNGPEINEENHANSEHENLSKLGKSTEVLIDVGEKDVDGLDVQFMPASNLAFNIKLSENDQLWQPSGKPLAVSEKLESEEPRLLAKEGFFVDQKPQVPSSHLNILERRLLDVDDKKWFNCEGELEILPNPYTKTSYRPHLFNQVNPQLETEYVAPTINPTLESILVPHNNILDITILALKFNHHPLFSPEHVFEQKLVSVYDTYQQKLSTNKLERIGKRLDALRSAKKNAEGALIDSKGDMKKLTTYRDKIKKLRELYFEEGRQSRMILKSILQTWKIIKKTRQTNEYSSTNIKLNIRKEKRSYDQEIHVWNAKIEETCTEIISELELDYQENMSNYKEQLEQWQQHVQNEDQIEEDIPRKPKKPVNNVDHEVLVHEIVEKFKESFKPPGEPILHFSLSYENGIADKTENSKEKLRKNAVTTTKVYLRVLCNKIEVCKLKPVSLNDGFTCTINENFSMQLSAIPEHIVVEILEQPSTLMKRKLGEVKIPIPTKNVSMGQSKILEQHFQKNEIVHYKHMGVGSGIELKSIFPEAHVGDGDLLHTSGALTCKVGWDINYSNAKDFEETADTDIVKNVLNADGTIDVKKLMEWAHENNPDPQDPKNSILYEYIRNYDQDFGEVSTTTTKGYFRYNSDMAPFEFCDSRDIEDNLRFQILQLRDRNEPEFVGMVVPNRLKEIPIDALAAYRRRCEDESKNLLDDDDFDEDEIDGKRSHGRKYLKQVHTKVFQQCRNTKNNLAYEDVVNEKVISYIESLTRNILSNILSWFQFQPTLKMLSPKVIRKTSAKTTDLNAPVKITISVDSALNVPLRSIVKVSSTSRTTVDTNTEEVTVRPFVEIAYHNVTLQTTCLEGCDPVWNEDLVLPLESTNTDYLSPNSLSGSVVVRLFDEITEKGRSGDIKAKNWLGSIEIPVSAVGYNNKMEGLFKLQKPAKLLGYEQDKDENYSNSKLSSTHQLGSQHTYLSLKFSVEPHISKLTQSMDELETTELPYIKQHILNWNEAYNTEYPHRKFSAFAIDINGKTACVTRYIRPLEPPQLNTDSFDVSAEQCARYVSMIPFTDCNKFYQNVWLSTEQLLKLMIGSVVDHAVALTCYLSSLDVETWLLLGYGIPHGSTAYVLVREHTRESQVPLHCIYDLVTSTKYDVMDTFCPLQKIFCVINKHNVWANIQRTDQIQLTRFDFIKTSDWLPLFTNQITAPTNSIQQKLVYSNTPDVKQLEIRVDKRIRKKFMKLRKYERTVWNHQLLHAFKAAVARCETESMHGRRNSELYSDIKNFSSTHSINGYIFNTPYTTISEIITAVIATGIHLHEGVHTEFGLTVQIYPYPNHTLVVWICLAVINRR